MQWDYQLIFGVDKQLHVISFALVSLLCGMILVLVSDRQTIYRRAGTLWMALVIVGIVEEYRQYFAPARSAELFDAIANMAGVTVGLLVPLLLFFIIRNRSHLKYPGLYFIVLIPLFIGLLYLNERPFVTFDEPLQEKMNRVVTFIGLED
ncbi:VanZ family protein [Thalassobacillus devorans]|uniref:VanZ family protein n=1 Tax=Thalassobacillus devorans TaxID=279813 RepID=UPI00048C276D|nr:VanZ family protein [Thalassobacillus devorans]